MVQKTFVAQIGAAALLLVGAPAHAAGFSPYMASLSVGGGVADFAQPRIRDATEISGTWDARLTIGTRTPIAFEAAYAGTAGSELDPAASDPTVTSTAVTGSARVNFTTWRIQPYIVGGAGWVNLHSYGRDAAPVAAQTFAHNANGVIVPIGGGISAYLSRHGLIDARGGYEFLTGVKEFTNLRERPDLWFVELRAGYAF